MNGVNTAKNQTSGKRKLKAKESLILPRIINTYGHYMTYDLKFLHSAHGICLWVSVGSQNKQQSLRHEAQLTGFYDQDELCLLRGTKLNPNYNYNEPECYVVKDLGSLLAGGSFTSLFCQVQMVSGTTKPPIQRTS